MKQVVTVRIDRLRLDRSAAGLTAGFAQELERAVRVAVMARRSGALPDWPVTTRPALRRAAETVAARMPAADPKAAP